MKKKIIDFFKNRKGAWPVKKNAYTNIFFIFLNFYMDQWERIGDPQKIYFNNNFIMEAITWGLKYFRQPLKKNSQYLVNRESDQ